MCGRYVAAKDPAALVEEFEASAPTETLAPDYNVAPTKQVYVVVDRVHEQVRERSIEIARWGLVPSWAKDRTIGSRLINARVETVGEKPSFRGALARRRCLVPADGYYEWYQSPSSGSTGGAARSGRPAKQPFFIRRRDGQSLAMAGLYEWWRDPAVVVDDSSGWLLTCTVITTEATDDVGRIHDRMPMTVARADWAAWLDPSTTIEPRTLLTRASDSGLEAYPVSTAVNQVRNNGPMLIEPDPTTDDGLFPGAG